MYVRLVVFEKNTSRVFLLFRATCLILCNKVPNKTFIIMSTIQMLKGYLHAFFFF